MEAKDLKPTEPLPEPSPKAPKKLKSFFRHHHILVVLLEAVAVGALLLSAAAGFLVFRLMSGPVDMGFARSYIQEALRVPEQGLTPVVGDIVLSWPDLNGPLLLGFKNAKLFNQQGMAVASVSEAALSLSKARLLIGQISPVALILREPVVQVVRTRRGRIVFGIVGMETKPDTYGPRPEDEESELERILRYIARPGKVHSGLGTLEAFKIVGARVVIEDKTLGSSWVLPRMDASFESQEDFLNADVDLRFSETEEDQYLKMNINLPWNTQEAQVKADIKNFDPWFFAQRIPALEKLQKGDVIFNGQMAGILDKDLKPLKALAELSSAQGKISSEKYSANAVPYKNFILHATYDAGKGKFSLTDSQITANGMTIHGKAALDVGPDKISGPIHLSLDEMAQSKIGPLWPPSLEGDNAEEWIVHKLSQGTFKNLYADLQVEGMRSDKEGWSFDVPNVVAGFAFEGMKVDYRPPLYPVTQGKGSGVFDLKNQTLDITVDDGKIGDLDVTSGKVAFTHIIEHGKGIADIQVKLKGPLATGLKYAALEPVRMKNKFDPDQVKGDADLDVHLNLPTRKDVKVKEVKIGVEGTLSNVFLPSVVKDLSLIGGPLTLKVKDNDLSVTGKGELGGRPASFDYKEFVESEGQPYKYTVKANFNTDEAFRDRLGIDVKNFLEGTAPVDVTYTEYPDGHSIADVKGDLGPVWLFINPFDYEKKPGIDGTVTLKALFKDGDVKDVTDMEVTAPDLSLRKADLSFRRKDKETVLEKGAIGDYTIGETKGSMNFTVDDTGRYKIKADSSFFDLRPFVNHDKDRKPHDNPPMLIELTAAQMKGADEKTMPPGKFTIDMDGQGLYNRLDVDTSAGGAPVTLHLGPDESGVRRFQFDAGNAGATLNAFGIYKNMRGGKMTVHGKASGPGENNMTGQGQITDFKVVNAPVLAQLISAMSLPGLAALLGGEGLNFSKLEADYKWNSRPDGSILEIRDGRTSGNSVGFSFEGALSLADSTLDMSGTMVPLSDINKIIGKIPLVGDILTGGGGLIAATYSVKGPTEKPGVMVNPLSVLTPGILRRILFE